MYSTFCSEKCPNEYESRLVQATRASQIAKRKWDGETRFGKTRQDLEQQLVGPQTSSSRLLQTTTDLIAAYTAYVEWETEPRARKNTNPKAPITDPNLTNAVFERAIAACARAAAAALKTLFESPLDTKQKSKDPSAAEARKASEQILRAYKVAEAGFWQRYASWNNDTSINARAVRACPQIGAAWKHYLESLVRMRPRLAELTSGDQW